MRSDKQTRHLNLFLIKESISELEEIIHLEKCGEPIDVQITSESFGRLFIRHSSRETPKWFDLFISEVDPEKIGGTSSVSAIFLIEFDGRLFALAFGQGGRFILQDDCFEERFGLIIALNSIERESFRCIDKKTFDTIQSHSRIQSIQKSSPYQFGLDVEQDILQAIVGTPKVKSIGSSIAGADSLSVSVKADLDDLPILLKSYKSKFDDDSYKAEYPWINNISEIKNKSKLIEQLDNILIYKLQSRQTKNIWLSIPEIIEWNQVRGFIFSRGSNHINPDINLKGFYHTIHKDEVITIKTLKSRKVWCADDEHNEVFRQWQIYKCMYAEIDFENQKYILSGGKWFNIADEFVAKTNDSFAKITYSNLELPEFCGGTETKYNAEIGSQIPDIFALMDDRKRIFHGGGSGQIEFCDLFSNEKELIHIKKYGQSSVFSHLFAQGFVSGKLLQLDAEFRRKVVEQLPDSHKELIEISRRPREGEFTIIYGIISDSTDDALHLPFFSRVNLNNTANELVGLGYNVQLLKIAVNQEFANTRIAPEKKTRH